MKREELTQELLKELLHYDPDTGIFTWKVRNELLAPNPKGRNAWNAKFAGQKAGNLSRGYIRIGIYSISYFANRLAFLYMEGKLPKVDSDHINGIKSDNRWHNLREATESENLQNLKKANRSNKSTGLLGSWHHKPTNKFIAGITINRKFIYIGLFCTKEKAHEAYINAKRKYHPFGEL